MVFAAVVASRDALYAPAWFGELGWTWADPLADQRRGAQVLLLAVPLLAAVLLLAPRSQPSTVDVRRRGERPKR
jgi:hypothetical protein